MCIIVVSYKQHPDYPLVVAANRDEFYRRRAAPLAWWGDGKILAGRDLGYATLLGRLLSMLGLRQLKPQGTWLGVNRQGRFAVVTNFREPGKESKTARSRGLLVQRYLDNALSVADFAAELTATRAEYNGFNLLFGTIDELFYFSNRNDRGAMRLEPGLHALSNAFLDTEWPKTERVRSAFAALPGMPPDPAAVFAMLHDSTRATPETEQQTGLPLEIELVLSSIFIALPGYGTRASSYLTFSESGALSFAERTYEKGQLQSDRALSYDT